MEYRPHADTVCLFELSLQAKLDRAYDDRLAARITDELWVKKPGEWEAELASVRREKADHSRPA